MSIGFCFYLTSQFTSCNKQSVIFFTNLLEVVLHTILMLHCFTQWLPQQSKTISVSVAQDLFVCRYKYTFQMQYQQPYEFLNVWYPCLIKDSNQLLYNSSLVSKPIIVTQCANIVIFGLDSMELCLQQPVGLWLMFYRKDCQLHLEVSRRPLADCRSPTVIVINVFYDFFIGFITYLIPVREFQQIQHGYG